MFGLGGVQRRVEHGARLLLTSRSLESLLDSTSMAARHPLEEIARCRRWPLHQPRPLPSISVKPAGNCLSSVVR
eukprot:scaffold154853_cov28-Tisochrysis_lutea.AAC.2